MKSSAYPLVYRQPLYMNCIPFLKENLQPTTAVTFQKSQPTLQIRAFALWHHNPILL